MLSYYRARLARQAVVASVSPPELNSPASSLMSFRSSQHGSMLPKILPWLWRLADEETNRFEAPTELANCLLQALTAVTATCSDPQVSQLDQIHIHAQVSRKKKHVC